MEGVYIKDHKAIMTFFKSFRREIWINCERWDFLERLNQWINKLDWFPQDKESEKSTGEDDKGRLISQSLNSF